jgi:hypothetical protein
VGEDIVDIAFSGKITQFLRLDFFRGKRPGHAVPSVSAMDIVTGLAVAGAVIQFVDFGTKFVLNVVSKRGQVYKAMQEGSVEDGFAAVDEILERDAKMISTITAKIQRPLRSNGSSVAASADEKALIELCKECSTIAAEVVNDLDGLKTKSFQIKNQKNWKLGMDNRTSSFLSTFKAVWTEEKLNNTSQRLSLVKKAIEVNILVSIRLVPILFSWLIFQVLTYGIRIERIWTWCLCSHPKALRH